MQSPFRWLCLAFTAFLIAIIVLANQGRGGEFWGFLAAIPLGDKLAHLLLLGAFTFLVNLSFPRCRPAPRPLSFLTLASFVVAILITAEELSQAFLSYRSFDLRDGLANLLGVVLGDLAARLVLRCRFPAP